MILEVPKESEGSSSPEPDWKDEQSVMSDLTCAAIFAMEDPIRDEVAMMLHSIFCNWNTLTKQIALCGGV